MFKLESYITPVLLNYVGKYVKNFKPEQSQVSLWDGDATFQNLDLELNVLNEQINFPFTFISGHIHELLIHVPWVKITSEPIVITINTIECILKMKDNSDVDNEKSLQQKPSFDSLQEEAPSGYIKSIVTKVVNNIEINCNNLILKFVEEDIVLSVNIRFLGFQNVNNLWQPAFTDINIRDMILRKLITMKDLTLCLDRMDASGKIEIYQDPVVYRCSMVIRWLTNYLKYESSQNQRESVSRFDIHFNKIEFSVTEQQIPMILRLITLFMNSQSKLYSGGGSSSTHSEKNDAIAKITDDNLIGTSSISKTNIPNNNSNNNNNNNNLNWSSWAWNTLSSFVPDWGGDWSPEKSLDDVIQVMDFGIYIDDAIITFKITEFNRELLTHKNVKAKYRPFVTLQLSGMTGTIMIHGSNFTGIQIGLGYIKVYPQGNCTCGFYEVNSSTMQGLDFYLSAGVFNSEYYKGSLFDLEAVENRGLTKDYRKIMKSRVYSAEIFDELVNRLSAFVLDYNHLIEMPEELIESELESTAYENLEFNNLIENKITKYYIGDLEIKITSGLLHRVSTIISLIENDFLAFFNNDTDETVSENLRAVTIEEYDALSNYIPIKNLDYKIKKLTIQFILADHYQDSQKMFIDNTKNIMKKAHSHPRLSIEIDSIELQIKMPIYPFKLVSCASQQTEIPITMLNNCYKQYNLKMLNVTSRLNIMDNCQMLFITPFDCQLSSRQLLHPQYWTKFNLIYNSYDFQIDNIVITTTKVKLLIINYILNSIFSPTNLNASIISTIISDACNEINPIILELNIENIKYLSNKYIKYTLIKGSISSIRIFALDNNNQAFIMSGSNNQSNNDDRPLLNLIAQYPNDFNDETDNLIFLLQFSKIKIILDPLLFNWLQYNCNPNNIQLFNSSRLRSENQTIDETSSDNSTRKKFPSLHENVHSPSDGDKKVHLFNWNSSSKNQNFIKKSTCEKSNMTSLKITNFILNHYSKWKKSIFNLTFDECVIYQPTISINSVGVDSINEAIEHALNIQSLLKIFVTQNSKFHVKSASWDNKYFSLLDSVDLINIDNLNIKNFPWTLDFDKFYCYSVINRNRDSYLDIKCSNITVDVTLKPNISSNNDNSCSTLGFCIYIHTEPIKISVTTDQLELIDYLLINNRTIFHLFSTKENNNQSSCTKLFHNDNLKFPFQHPLSPTQLFFTETQTTSTSASISRKESEVETDNTGGITAWIQWTITKIIIEFSTESNLDCDNRNKNDIFQDIDYKIVVELEDIITSIDWQLIYMKFKNKITAAKITHYEKLKSYDSYNNDWKLGSYTGLIMSSKNEDLNSKNEVDFLNLTVTKAKSNNVYNKWMKFNNNKFSKTYIFNDNNDLSMSNYIMEIVVEMQMIEIILPVNLINKFEKLLKCFSRYSESDDSQRTAHKQCPLMYVDFKGLNLKIPIDSSTIKRYDMLVLKTDGISIVPHAENPICRTILRSDIYELAAQSNILYTPGSILEDRQYQIKINNIYISSANWETYDIKLSKRKSQQLHTMNENPALEWNKIENDSSNEKLLISCLINKLNISCIFAPPMMLTSDVIVCGSAIEITFLTDIEVYLSLEQIQLLTEFFYRLKILSSTIFDEKQTDNLTTVIGPTNISSIRKSRIESIQEFREEIPKDSGIDVDTSSIDGGICLDSNMPNYSTKMPYEYVINCGKISVFIYEFKNESNDKNIYISNSKCPLFYVEINQPNGYISQKHLVYTVRINCFDVLIRINKENNITTDIPNVHDYLDVLLETKNGDPDSNTGIPPSFFIIKLEKNLGNYKLCLEMGRPTKINLSDSMFYRINVIKNKLVEIVEIMMEKTEDKNECSDTTSSSQSIFVQNNKIDTMNINLKTKQIVLAYKFNDLTEIINSLSESFITVVSKPRKIHGVVDLVSFMITSIINYNTKIFLNPFTCKFISSISWESWQNINANPLIQIQSYLDSMNFELGPDQLKILENIFIYVQNYYNQFNVEDIPEIDVQKLLSTEQHYQDDLKAGAFQFADGTNDQFPLPYQVLFSNFPNIIMAWKYPQPRVLTRLNLTDVLWEITNPEIINLDKITCVIEYWNDSLMSYQHFIDFKISEFDNFLLLPNKLPTRAVSCTWRAIIYSIDGEPTTLTARDLAECLRIDSYFNSLLIPSIEITLNINYIKLSIFNYFCHDNYRNLPYPLNNYKLNNLIPSNQCFATITLSNNLLFYNKWTNGAIMTDYSSTLSIQILDYESITMQNLLEPFTFNFQICQLNRTRMLLMTKELTFKFNAGIVHSLTLSLNSWYAILQNNHSRTIYNGIIIANDCNIPIRFTQDKTTDDFILQSRECYFYSWRQKSHSKLRIAIKMDNHWIWSDLFTPGSKNNVIDINNNGCIQKIFYKIKSITSTQKIIFFSGQLIIRNELNDNLELKLIKYDSISNNKTILSEQIFFISKNSTLPSLVINNTDNMAIKLKYSHSKSSISWTGDIPLLFNSGFHQPWLVKLPTDKNNQFVSIWVRIITENLSFGCKILVLLTPLFLIQSWLPSSLTIHINTLSLNVSNILTISEYGKKYQVYCAGTTEHSHELNIEFNNGKMLDYSIPMSYNFVDQHNYFKRPKNENIDVILDELDNNNYQNKSNSIWPFEYDQSNYIFVESQTDINVKYKDSGLISSTLLVELRPWCYIFNHYGKTIKLISSNTNFSHSIPSNGVISPPKIMEIFYIEIELFNNTFISSPLQFVNSDLKREFSMPQISGMIPLDGSIKIPINCQSVTAILIISSQIVDDIRVIKISSSHVVCNLTKYNLKVSSIYLNNNFSDHDWSLKCEKFHFNSTSNENNNSGTSIDYWINLDSENNDQNYSNLYFTLRLNNLSNNFNDWSCPINVNQSSERYCITVQDDNNSTLPIVITVQRDTYIFYITIHYDNHPQFTIKNSCPFPFVIGQPNLSFDSIEPDSPLFAWICKIKPHHTCNYTLKNFGSRLPDNIINKEIIPRLMFCVPLCLKQTNDELNTIDKFNLKSFESKSNTIWKTVIEFPTVFPIKFDQYIKIDFYGDIKVMVESFGHTIYIYLEPKSEIEVSIRDVRNRLMNENIKLYDQKSANDNVKSMITIKSNQLSMENSQENNLSNSYQDDNNIIPKNYSNVISNNSDSINFTIYFQGINIIITQDDEYGIKNEVSALYLMNSFIEITCSAKYFNIKTFIADLQLDNQLYEKGGYDFSVVFKSQNPLVINNNTIANSLLTLKSITTEVRRNSLLIIECSVDKVNNITAFKNIYIRILPINIYIEDKFITQLLDYATTLVRPFSTICFDSFNSLELTKKSIDREVTNIYVPENILINARVISSPLRLQNLKIDPISILLSIHTSARLYVALDHSPLQFGAFERLNVFTTPYKLGNDITMHYLSGAIFGAGWVVGSLEILGSPGSFAQALSSGLKDFISLPFRGLLQGPWGFIIGITHGSASLMKHITAGTVNSVTKLASSVARNLDRLTLDDEHLQRQEEARRLRPQSMTQGLYRGLTGFGISLLAAVAGLAHHPLQNFWSQEPSTRGIVTGVGLGLVGVVTKPLSGAAELVALTGQGLLQHTGWNSMPLIRRKPNISLNYIDNSKYRYSWKLMDYLDKNYDRIVYSVDAEMIVGNQNLNEKLSVVLVLTKKKLIIIDTYRDNVEKIMSLSEFSCVDENTNDPKLLRLVFLMNNTNKPKNHFDTSEIQEMDTEMRSRVEQYVLNTGFNIHPNESSSNDVLAKLVSSNYDENSLLFLFECYTKVCFINIIKIIKRQMLGIDFTVL
ncbi:vacuolar protein sorting-associated protein 13B [Chelonus insularis]|uniref:vacuolar protein sorting-associated protein 13B n=1 Tax=Chelonus insularis TaxID=460826 RepID=UPI00158CCBF5|nr:vacuolar protein sorting-associated protein 13B [Chelonus insularis]